MAITHFTSAPWSTRNDFLCVQGEHSDQSNGPRTPDLLHQSGRLVGHVCRGKGSFGGGGHGGGGGRGALCLNCIFFEEGDLAGG